MMKQHSLDKTSTLRQVRSNRNFNPCVLFLLLYIYLSYLILTSMQLQRKYGMIKGTAGSTPAQPSKVCVSSSRIFTATPVQPRPSSVISDAGTDAIYIPKKKVSLETSASSAKVLTLGKSKRVNRNGTSQISSSANRTVVRAGMDGSIYGSTFFDYRYFYSLGGETFALTIVASKTCGNDTQYFLWQSFIFFGLCLCLLWP